MLMGAAAAAASITAGRAWAADHDHVHHHHGGTPNHALIDAASDCVVKAQACVGHCIVAMGKGETDLAACAASASQVEAVCATLQKLAAMNSRHLAAYARMAIEVCKECEDECKKTEKHPECKACLEACVACRKECKKLAG
jgi:Cys-rich four helix bundle protein (predicted Tat secretion target)